ncbi:MAG: GatB/YqeY domain-containing protein [Bryobacteraceae bacterium]
MKIWPKRRSLSSASSRDYLPPAASSAELEEAVAAAIAESGAASSKQMGTVMKAAQLKLAGKRVDGKMLSELVKKKLS